MINSRFSPSFVVDTAGVLSCIAYGVLCLLSLQPAYIGVDIFLLLIGATWALMLTVFLRLRQGSTAIPLRRLLVWAVVFRIIGTLGEPILEDDHFRYLWDGRSFATTGNPYAEPPAASFHDTNVPAAFHDVLDNINNPDIPTIYGPTGQYVFLLSYWISPADLLPLKLLLLLADLGTLWLLYRLVRAENLILYAWCPLVIKETSFTAHIDSLGVFFLVAALYWFIKKRDTLVGAMLALAVGTKVLAILLVLLLLLKSSAKSWISFALTITALYLPFATQAGHAGVDTTIEFLADWEFNSSVVGLLSEMIGFESAKAVCLLLFAVFYIWYSAHYRLLVPRTLPRGDWIFGVFFLLSAVVNPWYLLWLLPFVVRDVSLWGIAAAVVVNLSYVHGLTLPSAELLPYHHPVWVRLVEYGIIAMAVLIDIWLRPTTTHARYKGALTDTP